MTHVFSVDVEDWYQGIEIPVERWDGFEQRVRGSTTAMLDLLAEHGVRGTCFVLGKVAEQHPDLVRDIHRRGHEIATHGYSHEKVYDLAPARFREELRRSIDLLQSLTGERVIGHRAPYFSVTRASLWALDILAEEGILYDSSVHPVFNYRYGIPDANRLGTTLQTSAGHRLLELPVSTFPLPKLNIPVGGGAYLRLYPYFFLKSCLRALERRGEVVGIYMHPWELDPDHPKVQLPFRVAATHYVNLRSTRRKLDALLADFTFAPYREVYGDQLKALQR